MRRVLIFAALACAALPVLGAPLRFCYEDVPQPPWTMPDGRGLNLELLRRVEKLLGESFVFEARPWARCQEETRAGLMDGMVGPSDAPERRVYSRPPELPDGRANPALAMFEDRVELYLRKGSGAHWDGKTLTNPRGLVIIPRGYAIASQFRASGQRVLDNMKSPEESLRLLAVGAADVCALMGLAADAALRQDARLAAAIERAPQPYATYSFYLMVNLNTYARETARIEAIWNAIPVVRAQPDYHKLDLERRMPP